MTDEQLDTAVCHPAAPCRNCGSYTRVRVEGKPYCSGKCIRERRLDTQRRADELAEELAYV